MQIKTSKLTGAALNWAVAKCEGVKYRHMVDHIGAGVNGSWWVRKSYSTDWSQGGPIIERECITLVNADGADVWSAYPIADNPVAHRRSGSTPLIAAMRCYVASKFGDSIEIPDQLL